AAIIQGRLAVADAVHLVAHDYRRFGRYRRNREYRKRIVPLLRPERCELRRSAQPDNEYGVPTPVRTWPSLGGQRRGGTADRRMAAQWHPDGENRSAGEYHSDAEGHRHAGRQQ